VDSPSFPPELELLERTVECTIVGWRRLMLVVWHDQATASGILRSRTLFEPWATRQPGGAAILVVVPAKLTRPPDEAARRAMVASTRAPEGIFRGMGTLLEAEGFIAASARAIVARIHRFDVANIFRTVDEAAAWAARVLDDPGHTAEGLAAAIRTARGG
jgi:hypothetical protein